MLGGNKKRVAPPLKKIVKEEEETTVDLPRPLFRGFIGGDVFITKKGYRGLKLESLWVQNLFEAFKTDDAELAAIALQSSIADVNDRVIGGNFGCPYSIGDYGFYAEKQFKPQLKYLQDRAREIAEKTKVYLSHDEWENVEKKLLSIANFGNPDFTSTTVGDSFADLAIRQNAFQVARVVMNAGIDPLVENSEGKDMFDTMKEQYHTIALHLREVQELKTEAAHKVMVPTAVEHIMSEEMRLLDNFHFLSEFGDDLKVNLEKRVKEIALDKILQRRAELRNETFPDYKVWNIAQLDKAEKYIKEVDELKHYIVEKISYHESHAGAFQSLSKLLIANFRLVNKKTDASTGDGGMSETPSLENTSTTAYSSVETKSTTKVSRHSKHTKEDRSVISLTGESATSEALKVGFVFVDDTSVLTEDGQPSRIPKLPYIPNRLRNAKIDGLNKHYRGKRRSEPNRVRSRASTRGASAGAGSGDGDQSVESMSPSAAQNLLTGLSAPTSPLALPTIGTPASLRPNSQAQTPASPGGFSVRPLTNNSSQISIHRGGQSQQDPSARTPLSGFSPRVTTTGSSGMHSPHTPSQKIREAQSLQEEPPPLQSTEDLYALLGVTDTDDASSVASVGSRGNNSGVALTSAKILAKSLKVNYAPILGTLRETEDSVIMYR